MSNFWDIELSDDICLIDEDGAFWSYARLHEEVQLIKQKITVEEKRRLVFLESSASVYTVISYLACLQLQYPVLLVDNDLDEELKAVLCQVYQPNLIVKTNENSSDFLSYSNEEHQFHSELAVLLSTSGTTGDPKLVKLSFKNIQSNAVSIAKYLGLTQTDRAISSLPLFYSYGLSVLNSHLQAEASFVIANVTVMQKEFWELFEKHSVTSISGVPFTYEMLSRLRFSRMDLPSLRYMTQAGGRLEESLVQEFALLAEKKGFEFFVMYGQTEATARISYLPSDKVLAKSGSIGNAIPGGKLSLIDINNNEILVANYEGELVYQGENVMLGYAKNRYELSTGGAENTLKTGDIAYVDEEGDYFITGRAKRFIKLFGLRLNLDQMESFIAKNELKCFCGGKDQLLGVAVLETDAGTLDMIVELISDKFKVNKKYINPVIIDNELPLLPSGKINYKVIFNEG